MNNGRYLNRSLPNLFAATVDAAVRGASPHEVRLVGQTLAKVFTKQLPERLIGDRAYDYDPLDAELTEKGIELIAPHRT